MKSNVKTFIIVLSILLCSFVLPINYVDSAVAAEVDSKLEAKLIDIESRLSRARLVIKKLKYDYLLAVKSNQAMRNKDLPLADINRIEHEFKQKVEKMIDAAMDAINNA